MFKLTIEAVEKEAAEKTEDKTAEEVTAEEVTAEEVLAEVVMLTLETVETGSDTPTLTVNVLVPATPPNLLETPRPSSQPNGGAIRDTGTSRGIGLVAQQDLPRQHRIIEKEDPILSCHFRSIGKKTLSPSEERILQDLVRDYAFQEPEGRMELIFESTSHINHACMTCANAQFVISPIYPHDVTVALIRDVKEGEEVFIHYNKPVRFPCAVCGSKRRSQVRQNPRRRIGLSQFIYRDKKKTKKEVKKDEKKARNKTKKNKNGHEPTIGKRLGQGFKSLLNTIDPRKWFRRAHQDDVMEN
ncbi:hypothetical protein NW762_000458 [Fusarium torreyae]|uniref:SET domain-containing protein n=1 Tax=Fusarium torreyae TaxID=1237075 RepID=A0A9W8SGF2_9HYPO|nr:hypothetical protein NW762_000458 [Fusarium torreyae]